ncbi:flavodoxin [Aquibacillus saliphilus]|uniref:flavodoxin n=1 Tax=Aquibacillus saliphilus TaxID=1909422 RepID=UPI001CF09EC0|nr:flavodoxin [Aquibacillus saliphilus]
MFHVLLVYTSMTGNTEQIAKQLVFNISEFECINLTTIDIFDSYPEEIDEYDAIIIGSYTWGDGDIPDEMLDFFEELSDYNIKGKAFALFGSGEQSYEYFCGALDTFEDQLDTCGAYLPLPSLKIDMDLDKEDIEACKQFTKDFLNKVTLLDSKLG